MFLSSLEVNSVPLSGKVSAPTIVEHKAKEYEARGLGILKYSLQYELLP